MHNRGIDYKAPSFGIQIVPGIHWIWLPLRTWDETSSTSVWTHHSCFVHLPFVLLPFPLYSGFVQGMHFWDSYGRFKKHLTSSPSCHVSHQHFYISFCPPPMPRLHLSISKATGLFPTFLAVSLIISWLGVLCPAKSLPVRIVEKWLMLHFSCGALKIQKIRSPSSFWDSRKKNKSQ